MRILAIDPGERFIGLAISDPTGTIANPVGVIRHKSREEDAKMIARLAAEKGASVIVIGQATAANGKATTLQARRATNLADAVKAISQAKVVLWDETNSTKIAAEAWRSMKVSRRRKKRIDAIAATVILQDFLDAQLNANRGWLKK